ncbi:lactate dehydrogenase-like 2-hydroxyacid dehydrogenase [Conyzicola nivalis]|uniref:Lactate dehydrogenase-like 2-hydroxyacid dehydrogenase n=1 Tax=Conyzicola nivalis TaxID=1477021 RepID=A0ABV2QRJ3_9MICO
MTTDIESTTASVPGAPGTVGRILQVGALMPPLARALAERYDALVLPADAAPFIAEHGADIGVVVTSGGEGVGTELMASLTSLKAVVNFGVGYDTTDVDQARRRGIVVSNTPDVLTDCVADTAVGLLIDTLRRFSAADRFVRSGGWASARYPLATSISGKRVGILGLGRIGRAIAHRLEGFGCVISYHNRTPASGVDYAYVSSLLQLARESDVLVVAAAGGDETQRLVSAEVIDALGETGFLVNIARGSVVDQDALVAALVEGRLAGAGLDVFDDEPNVPAELLALDTVVLLPHLASGTVETRRAMTDLTLANLDAYLADRTLVTPV